MTRPYRLGLTGSIGMGKSTAAAMFAAEGVPVWDADAAVARAYGPGGAAVGPIRRLWPDAVREDRVDREVLRRKVAEDPGALAQIEAAVHPLLGPDRQAFYDAASAEGARLVVFDVPLLFETGLDAWMDGTLVISAPEQVQRARVLARHGMTEERLEQLLARQMPDAEKRRRATHVIPGVDMAETRAAVRRLVRTLGPVDA